MRSPVSASSAAFALVTSLALGLLACSSDPAPPVDDPGLRLAAGGEAAGGTTGAGSNTAGGNGAGNTTAAGGNTVAAGYPAGPYGTVKGSVIADTQFNGLRNPKAANYKFSSDKVELISLRDFYNPTGDKSKPRVLLVAASAGWCGPCKLEAEESMANYVYWNPKGAEFLTTLFDSSTAGEPATPEDASDWASDFKLEYPVVTDPTQKMGQYANLQAVPFNLVIDLTTMTIVYAEAAVFDASKTSPTLIGLLE